MANFHGALEGRIGARISPLLMVKQYSEGSSDSRQSHGIESSDFLALLKEGYDCLYKVLTEHVPFHSIS